MSKEIEQADFAELELRVLALHAAKKLPADCYDTRMISYPQREKRDAYAHQKRK